MAISNSLFNMFGRSPIKPLQQHMETVYQSAESLQPFFEAVLAQDWLSATTIQAKIAEIEAQADSLKKDLRLHLPQGLFMPVPRGDILEILTMQDRIANLAEDISGLVLGRKMQLPADIADLFMTFLGRCIDAIKQAQKAIDELDELLETGFKGNEVQLVEEMIDTLDIIEDDTDEMQMAIRKELFVIEKQLAPIDAMFLYKVIELTGALADKAHNVGGQLEILLAR